jgi:hypothetical protein
MSGWDAFDRHLADKPTRFPIETAPQDGRVILVGDPDVGEFPMAWNPVGTNVLFAPGDVGIWEMFDRSFTWRAGEYGPTSWRPLAGPAHDTTQRSEKGEGDEADHHSR